MSELQAGLDLRPLPLNWDDANRLRHCRNQHLRH